jgi:uncharacterized MAPEG superfamily protein
MNYARFTVAYWCVLVAVLLPYVCAYLPSRAAGQAAQPGRL